MNDVHHDEEDAKIVFFSKFLDSVVYVFWMETMITEREEKAACRSTKHIICSEIVMRGMKIPGSISPYYIISID